MRRHVEKAANVTEHPGNRAKGLSSSTNQECVLEILQNSTPEEIARVLHRARYKAPVGKLSFSPQEISEELKKRVHAYLATEDGQREQGRVRRDVLQSEAQKWLEGAEGQAELREWKAILIAGQVENDDEAFGRACRDAIEAQVERWLNSPVGQETIEQERQRAVRNALPTIPASKGSSRVKAKLQELASND